MWISNTPVYPECWIKRYYTDEMAAFTKKQLDYLQKRKEVMNMDDKEMGHRQTDLMPRRVTIEEQLSNSIASAEASNVRLKKLQELQGLLERNKSVARILELQRELGF